MAPPVNLALHLRLARILTGKSATGEAHLGPEDLACLAVLDDLMVAIDERVELLRLPEAVEAAAEETVVLDSEDTAATAVMNLAEVEAAVAEIAAVDAGPSAEVVAESVPDVLAVEIPEAEDENQEVGDSAPTLAMDQIVDVPHVWGPLHDQLYEDVLWLFKMGDNEGALNSLTRLLDFGEGTEELDRFLTINRQKLYDLYHRFVGDPSALIERQEDVVIGDRYFYQRAEVEALLEQVNGARPIGEVIEGSNLSDLKVYSYLHRIRREGLVRIHRSDA
ncbi:MAG: hypothetical protein ABIK09_08285 [Pseudomonadota bacterium]